MSRRSWSTQWRVSVPIVHGPVALGSTDIASDHHPLMPRTDELRPATRNSHRHGLLVAGLHRTGAHVECLAREVVARRPRVLDLDLDGSPRRDTRRRRFEDVVRMTTLDAPDVAGPGRTSPAAVSPRLFNARAAAAPTASRTTTIAPPIKLPMTHGRMPPLLDRPRYEGTRPDASPRGGVRGWDYYSGPARPVAQWIERLPQEAKVAGSNPGRANPPDRVAFWR
jgi:hypothetical protein